MTSGVDRDVAGVLAAIDARALREAETDRVSAWIHGALEALARDVRGGSLDSDLRGTQLSAPVLSDAIETAIPTHGELVLAARAIADRPPIGRVAMILPSNVETTVVRPLIWALLARDEVAIRVSTRAPGVAHALARRLRDRDRELGRALAVLDVDRRDARAFASLASWADAVHAWGRDETIVELERVMGRSVQGHGSGLSLVVISGDDADSLDVDALARDVARHDQRGCLSPHAIVIEDASADARVVTEALDAALSGLGVAWSRGGLSKDEAAAERSWRDTAQAIAEWVGIGEAHAVSLEAGEIRDTPGLRNVAVHVKSPREIDALLARLGPRLKSLGVSDVGGWRSRAPRGVHVVPIGEMQTPPLAAPADGLSPWTGFVGAAEQKAATVRTISS